MKYLLVLMLTILICGCENDIPIYQIKIGEEACITHGGVANYSVIAPSLPILMTFLNCNHVTCNDGTWYRIENKEYIKNRKGN